MNMNDDARTASSAIKAHLAAALQDQERRELESQIQQLQSGSTITTAGSTSGSRQGCGSPGKNSCNKIY